MAQDLSITTPSVNALVYRNSGSSFGSPTFTAVAGVQDLDVQDESTEANTTAKGMTIGVVSRGYRNVTVNFKLVYIKGDAGFSALATACKTPQPIHLLVLNGKSDTNGAIGYNGDWEVVKFSKGEPLDGQVTYDVTLKPANTVNRVVDYTVSA